MLDTAVAQAKQSGQYNKAYDTAYEKAYPKAHDEAYEKAFDEAHDEAYEKAYDEAWNKVLDEINEKYADAEEKYELNDPDFKETRFICMKIFTGMKRKIMTTTELRMEQSVFLQRQMISILHA